MKIISAFLFATTANAFQVHQARAPQTALKMGFFDFKPMHGSGSGASENEIDEQYKLQQEMVRTLICVCTFMHQLRPYAFHQCLFKHSWRRDVTISITRHCTISTRRTNRIWMSLHLGRITKRTNTRRLALAAKMPRRRRIRRRRRKDSSFSI
jgi:hypothetical protein